MIKLSAFFILLILFEANYASSPTSLNDKNLPPQFHAFYDVHKKGLKMGEMEVKLIKNSSHIVYESITSSVGLAALFTDQDQIIDRSILVHIDESYRTYEFSHKVIGGKKNRDEHYRFDWERNIAHINYKGTDSIIEVSFDTFDNFSTQLLLMRKPDQINVNNTYSVISKGKLKNYIYRSVGKEIIVTKLGKLSAFKYIREKNNDKKTTYFGWYAESLNYLPVRLDKFENGKIDLSIQITEIQWK